MNVLLVKWHKLVYSYNRILYDSCLDEQHRNKLKKNLEYHENRLIQVEARILMKEPL